MNKVRIEYRGLGVIRGKVVVEAIGIEVEGEKVKKERGQE